MTSGLLRMFSGQAFGDLAAEVEHDDLLGDRHDHRHVVLDEQHRQRRTRRGSSRTRSPSSSTSEWVSPAAGSSSSSSRGRAASARAISMRFSVPYGSPTAGRFGDVARATAGRGSRARRAGGSASNRRASARRPCTFSATVSAGNSARFWNVRAMPTLRDAVRGQREQVVARRSVMRAARRLVEAADAVEQRRLARAVRPDERADLALFDRRTTGRRARRSRRTRLARPRQPTEPRRRLIPLRSGRQNLLRARAPAPGPRPSASIECHGASPQFMSFARATSK